MRIKQTVCLYRCLIIPLSNNFEFATLNLSCLDRVNIQLLISSSDKQLSLEIRQISHSKARRLRNYTIRQLPIILQEHMTQRDLDLIRRKEPPRARMIAMTKAQVVKASADKMGVLVLLRCFPHSQETIAVEFCSLFVVIAIPHVSRIADNLFSFLDHIAIWKSDVCHSLPSEGALKSG